MYTVLIVDDEPKIRELIAKYVRFDGGETFEAGDGMQAVELCRQRDYDIIIMDVMMPHLDGFSAVREIRKIKDTPIIMLTARGEEYDRLHGFEGGADDYVVKPFSPRELMMRVQAILKRVGKGDATPPHEVYEKDGLRVDFTARTVAVDGVDTQFAPKEYDLLLYLVRNRGIALSRDKLICDVWGYDFDGDDRTLDTHIRMLRRALGAHGGRIATLRGLGYRFDG